MNGIFFCVCLTFAISVPQIVLKWCRKERKKIQVKKWVTAKSKPMMNLVLRCSERTLDVLASTASESPEKTRHECQLLLRSWNEQQPRTERLVEDAYSSSYLLIKLLRLECWRKMVFSRMEIWWIDGSKNREIVNEQPSGLFAQHTDRFVVDDDDMNSNIVAESEVSLKSRSFLHRVNDQVRKMQDQSSKMQHRTATNTLWYGECLCLLHYKHLYSWWRIT